MSNSPLISYTAVSPNRTAMTGKQNLKITPHHMAGNLTVEQCGAVFADPARQASSNYGIGGDGRIGLYVNECDRAWTSGSTANDSMAVTIEVANDGGEATGWHVSDAALEALVRLCVEICRRNGIKRLSFTGDSAGNLTYHSMFQATQCPGAYLKGKFPYIAEEVNKRLDAALQEDEIMTGKQIAEALMQYQATNWDGSGEDGSRFAQFLETAITGRQGYADVPDWARAEFDEAVKLGITDGTSPGVFIPRYQAALMAVRARNAARRA